jgi:7-keto-8-aminopelargonate synthetase-like enzyme
MSMWQTPDSNSRPDQPKGTTRNQTKSKKKSSNSVSASPACPRELDGPPDAKVTIDGRTFLYFAGTGYLGLQSHPEVLASTCEATLRYGIGAATSRTAFTATPLAEVERKTAKYFGTERAFHYPSGYFGNRLLVDALGGTFDRVYLDEASHYSLFESLAGSRVPRGKDRLVQFRHADVDDLREKLEKTLAPGERPLVMTDGVFSALGTIAPIPEICNLLEKYDDSALLVDDAHGVGVLGKQGLGTLDYYGIPTSRVNRTCQDDCHERIGDTLDALGAELGGVPESKHTREDVTSVRLYLTATLSKALGGFGGVIPGSDLLIERVIERGSLFTGASPIPSPIAAASSRAMDLVFSDDALRNQLAANALRLKEKLRSLGLDVASSPVPIVSLSIGSAGNMRRIQRELSERGILIAYLPRYAGLDSGGALRIAVFATHQPEMIDLLVESLDQVL